MTFREKFHKEFPKEKDFNPASKWCPSSFDYEEDWLCCPTDRNPEGPDCDECWDREIPERKVFYLCDGRRVFEERKQVNECENNMPITIEIKAYPSVSASKKKDLLKLIEERIRCMK